MDYDEVTKKFDLSLRNFSFIKFTELYAAISSFGEENKNYQLSDNHDHIFVFRSALNNITFSTKWVYNRLHEFNIVKQSQQQGLWSKDLNILSVVA